MAFGQALEPIGALKQAQGHIEAEVVEEHWREQWPMEGERSE